MASIILPVGLDPNVLADLAGSNRQNLSLEADRTLDVPDVGQPALNAALVDYQANQAARESAFAQAQGVVVLDRERDRLDNEKILKAFAELLVDEFNILRALHSLPDRTFAQLRTAIRNKVT